MSYELKLDDVEHHSEGCDCGLCNSNGISIGVGVYPTGSDEVVERFYACSEDSARQNAKLFCREKGLYVQSSVEEEAIDTLTELVKDVNATGGVLVDVDDRPIGCVADPSWYDLAVTTLHAAHVLHRYSKDVQVIKEVDESDRD